MRNSPGDAWLYILLQTICSQECNLIIGFKKKGSTVLSRSKFFNFKLRNIQHYYQSAV